MVSHMNAIPCEMHHSNTCSSIVRLKAKRKFMLYTLMYTNRSIHNINSVRMAYCDPVMCFSECQKRDLSKNHTIVFFKDIEIDI